MRKKGLLLLAITAIFTMTACATTVQERAALNGGLIGAGAGAIIGHQFGNGGRDKGALIGAALGSTAGLFYGGQQQGNMANRNMAPTQYGQNRGYGQRTAGGDDFRNPYKMPDARYCNGRWDWEPASSYWICR